MTRSTHNKKYLLHDKMWRLYTEASTYTTGRRLMNLADKISTKLMEIVDRTIYDPHLLYIWDRINTQKKTPVDWDSLQTESIKSPFLRQRWVSRLASRKSPTDQIIEKRGMWT